MLVKLTPCRALLCLNCFSSDSDLLSIKQLYNFTTISTFKTKRNFKKLDYRNCFNHLKCSNHELREQSEDVGSIYRAFLFWPCRSISAAKCAIHLIQHCTHRLWKYAALLKLSCDTPFTHAENACVLRTIDTYLQAVWANSRLISSNQGKNAMQ